MSKHYYDIKITDASFDYNIEKHYLLEAVKSGVLGSEKRQNYTWISSKEVEEKLDFKKLRLQKFELEEVEIFLARIVLLMSNFKEFEKLSDENYGIFYNQLERIVREFFKDLYTHINKGKGG